MAKELIEATPIAKPGTSEEVAGLRTGGPDSKSYTIPALYLGQFVHEVIQANLRGVDRTGGTGYLQHLNEMTKSEIGTVIGNKVSTHIFEKLIPEIERMTGSNDPNKTTYWFAEIPFQPSVMQVENIERLKNDDDVTNFARTLNMENTAELAKELITSADPQKFMKMIREGLSGQSETVIQKVFTFLESMQTYYYFDLTFTKKIKEGQEFNMEEIPDRFKNLIATAAARTDLFSLSIEKTDTNSLEVLDWFHSFIEGKYFGKRPLHDLSSYFDYDKSKMYELLEGIRTGIITFNLVEVKTKFSKADFKETVFDDHYKDIAHTLWSMYQLVTSIYRLDNGTTIDDLSWKHDVLQIMTAESEEKRLIHLRKVIRNMRGFISNYDFEEELLPEGKKHAEKSPVNFPPTTKNNVLLARLYFPIVRVTKTKDIDGRVKVSYSVNANASTIESTDITSRVDSLNKVILTRHISNTGVSIVKEVSQRHTQPEDELTTDSD